jgi:hypothetical protein
MLNDAAREGNLPEALAALDRGADINWLELNETNVNFRFKIQNLLDLTVTYVCPSVCPLF